jgi:hypothetical protein
MPFPQKNEYENSLDIHWKPSEVWTGAVSGKKIPFSHIFDDDIRNWKIYSRKSTIYLPL